jgi:ATP-dependent RNA helicase DDX3X
MATIGGCGGDDSAAGEWATVTRSGRSSPAGRYPNTTTPVPAPAAPRRHAPTPAELVKAFAGLEIKADEAGRYPNTTTPTPARAAPRRHAPTAAEVVKAIAGLEIKAEEAGRGRPDKDDIHLEVRGEGAPLQADGFEQAGLVEAVLRNVARCGYDSPTEVQRDSMPIVLHGSDPMACAQTGSAMPAAFCLPMASGLVAAAGGGRGDVYHDYSRAARSRAPLLAPTPELAPQVCHSPRVSVTVRARSGAVLLVGMRCVTESTPRILRVDVS